MKKQNKIEPNITEVLGNGNSSKGKKHVKIWLIVIILIAALIVVPGFLKRSGSDKVMQFQTKPIKQGDITVMVTATGTLEPTNEVEVGCEVSGILENVEVDFNSRVESDQILAKLDTSKLEAVVTQSKAALETAKANVLQTEATLKETKSKLDQYKEVRKLSDGKVPSKLNYDAAEAAYERAKADVMSAKADVSKAKANLDADETDLSKAVIRSPINGIVLTREVEAGQTVAASFETPILFTIAEDLTEMELHVNVDEADIGQIEEGQKAMFTVDAYPERTFDAEITEIRYGAETVDGVVTYETVLKVDNTDLSLRPGMTATADIIVLQVSGTTMVTNSALRFEMPQGPSEQSNGGILSKLMPHPPGNNEKKTDQSEVKPGEYTIWVLKDGIAQQSRVKTGVTDGVHTQVVEGDVKAGDEAIVSTLNAGM